MDDLCAKLDDIKITNNEMDYYGDEIFAPNKQNNTEQSNLELPDSGSERVKLDLEEDEKTPLLGMSKY